jgi:CheY-like chemotaxis protein
MTKVLLLDDNPLVLRLSRAILEQEQIEVLTAINWLELNNRLVTGIPDIIFLDVNLPGIKGNKLSELLKSDDRTKDVPIILISDLPERMLEEILPTSGANAWLRKPLTREKYLNAIRQYVPSKMGGGGTP